jgi:hypothetical protein
VVDPGFLVSYEMSRAIRACLGVDDPVVTDDNTPPKVLVTFSHLHQPTSIEER